MMREDNLKYVILNDLWKYLDYESLIELGKTSKKCLKIIENRKVWEYLLNRDYQITIGKQSVPIDFNNIISYRIQQGYDELENYALRKNYDPRENYEFMRYVLPEYQTFIKKENLSLCCSECRCWGETDDPCFRCQLFVDIQDNDNNILNKLKQSVFRSEKDPIECLIKPGNEKYLLNKNYYEIELYNKVLKISGYNIYDVILQLVIEHARFNHISITYYIRQTIRIIYFEKYEYGMTIDNYGNYKNSINTFINILEVLENEWCNGSGCFNISNITKINTNISEKIKVIKNIVK